MSLSTATQLPTPSFFARHGQKLAALAVWVILLGSFFFYINVNNIPLEEIPSRIQLLLATPILFILFYALRPILFFPASILTIAGGVIYGPIGVIWVVLGANLSALVAYFVGRFFGDGLLDTESDGILQRYTQRLRDNSFETVLIMRFIYLPYDLVNYLSGLLRVDWRAFILATAVGSIPGTIFFTLIGASFDNIENALSGELPELNPLVLGISISMFVASLLLSRYFKRREANRA